MVLIFLRESNRRNRRVVLKTYLQLLISTLTGSDSTSMSIDNVGLLGGDDCGKGVISSEETGKLDWIGADR